MARKKRWRHSVGTKPNTVVAEERDVVGGMLQVRIWDKTLGSKGGWRKKSLGHRDRDKAKEYAADLHAKLVKGDEDLRKGVLTLGRILAAYRQHQTPKKSKGEQKSDARRIRMWTRVLGAGKDPHRISSTEWDNFKELRKSGAIDARGSLVDSGERRAVGDRTVEADLRWLRLAFNWAMKWRTSQGHYLMRENPVRGFEIPKEKNPQRPVASRERFEAIRRVSDQHTMEVRWSRKREALRSYLPELLDIVNGTGRRISAVCQLKYEDLLLERDENLFPFGRILWPADTDKQGRDSLVPIGPDVRAALGRIINDRPGIGSTPIFPSPKDRSKPITRHLADKWLREGERLAGLEPQKGSLWHAYRRKWATERKHLPDKDVMAAGGWASLESLKTAYQQADAQTILKVVLEPGELREVR